LATLNEIPIEIVDDIILVDDCSFDKTIEIEKSFGLNMFTSIVNTPKKQTVEK
jgi:glycosyltransferase involved in cell wall biosynthesis